MHLCIPTHTTAARFHHKSPQPRCNTRSICGPHMSPNSGLEVLLLKKNKAGGEEEQKNNTWNTIKLHVWTGVTLTVGLCDANRSLFPN